MRLQYFHKGVFRALLVDLSCLQLDGVVLSSSGGSVVLGLERLVGLLGVHDEAMHRAHRCTDNRHGLLGMLFLFLYRLLIPAGFAFSTASSQPLTGMAQRINYKKRSTP